jgi:hypothetical protein
MKKFSQLIVAFFFFTSVTIANNMVHYPFFDNSTPNRGIENTLVAENEETFRWNFSKLFLPHVIEAIKRNKYRAYNSKIDIRGVSSLKKGQYMLQPSTDTMPQYYDLIFGKIQGAYKLLGIAFYQ